MTNVNKSSTSHHAKLIRSLQGDKPTAAHCVIIIIIILYTYIAHQTIKLSLMRWVRILTEQECF